VSLNVWNALDAETKAIVARACAAEASFALAEMERLNAHALTALTSRHNVQLRTFPTNLIATARRDAADVLADVGRRSDVVRKVHESYLAFRERTAAWSRISLRAVLEARPRDRIQACPQTSSGARAQAFAGTG
jgi:TRAP-type mannitol/chloroaromatic compound transport system substrate-binding protein